MQYFKVCKYDYDNPDYINDWMTANELLEESQVEYPVGYYSTEQQFIDMAHNFLSLYDGMYELHHYRFFVEDDDFASACERAAAFSNLLIDIDISELTEKEFHSLSFKEKLLVFQLSLRGVAQIGLRELKTGACFSDMSDGFYWFLALPDNVPVEKIVKPQKGIYVYEWHDIWSEE